MPAPYPTPFQNKLLYHPQLPGLPFKRTSENPRPYDSPASWKIEYEEVRLRTADGVGLHGWFLKAPRRVDYGTAPTIVFFHANAGNIGFRLPNLDALVNKLEANVFIFDYRGYGDSDEVAIEEEGLKLDADAAMAYVAGRADIDRRKVFLFGRSLGGAVAIHTATKHGHLVAGLILESTFTSISDIVDHVFPVLSHIKWLVLNIKWASVDAIPHLPHPMLFIGGARDALVPLPMLKRLVAAATSSVDKELMVVEDGDHNDTFQKAGDAYIVRLRGFISRTLRRTLGDAAAATASRPRSRSPPRATTAATPEPSPTPTPTPTVPVPPGTASLDLDTFEMTAT